MRWLRVVLLCLTACGRIAFDPLGDGDGGNGDSDAPTVTGAVGPRWITKYDNTVVSRITGANGEVVMVTPFSTTLMGDNLNLTGSGVAATAIVRYDTAGTIVDTVVLESDAACDMRDALVDGNDLVLAGFANTNTALPQYGLCGIVAPRQAPLVFRMDPSHSQTLISQWDSAGLNAQAWDIARLSDGSFVVDGIYGQDLTIGATMLPTATANPSVWIARTVPGSPMGGAWARAIAPATTVFGGPLAADGDETCMLGSFNGPATVLGTALPYVGMGDAFVARIDATGNARFVRAIGSANVEAMGGDGSILALPDGGCVVGIDAPGLVTLDSMSYDTSIGNGLVVRFSSTGSVVSVRRFPTDIYITRVGARTIGLYRVGVPVMIGATPYTPMGTDVVVVDLGATAADDVLLASIGGAGNQDAYYLTTVGPDAVGFIVVSDGALTFGGASFDTGVTSVRALGVVGI